VAGKYKPGDLVCLNEYGFFITSGFDGLIGIIVTGPYSIITPAETAMDTFYTVYDILLDGQLFKMVPEEFMESYGNHEKNTE
tara:strand:+ start:279 stop:524 length:246 start_codon:yes stop_codon:yes gene_type:complete